MYICIYVFIFIYSALVPPFLISPSLIPDLKYLTVQKGQTPMVISSQVLDLQLYQWFEQYYSNSRSMLPLPERIQMSINLLKALRLMNSKYINCDIKTENIMLRKISEQEAYLNMQQGLKVLEAAAGEYWQVYFIDMGLAVDISQMDLSVDSVNCSGGTVGFLPEEFFDENASLDMIDLYGLGIALIDQELVSAKLDLFGLLVGNAQRKRLKKEVEFTKIEIAVLKKKKLMMALENAMDDLKHVVEFRRRILEVRPSIQQDLEFYDDRWGILS